MNIDAATLHNVIDATLHMDLWALLGWLVVPSMLVALRCTWSLRRRRRAGRPVLRSLPAALLALSSVHLLVVVPPWPAWPACPSGEDVVQVDSRSRTLTLCQGGRAMERYRVSLAWAGVDKSRTRKKDLRTPRGSYQIKKMRASYNGFHRFLHIDWNYQDGGDASVGIHGPGRKARFLGPLGPFVAPTLGCVRLSFDSSVEEVEAWLEETGTRKVVIR